MPIKAVKGFHWVLRLVLAALFVVSAIAKLFAIDDFELYIFSYGLLPLNLSYVSARLCIAAELTLGIWLLLGVWRRVVVLASFVVLVLFSLFLCYAALSGRTDSCQCMGRLANMPPALSLLKNAVLMVLVLLYGRVASAMRPARRWLRVVGVVVPLVATVSVFCISVPDSWMFGPEELRYDRELLEHQVAEAGLDQGHQLVALVTPGCPYCRMTREKLGYIAERNHLDTTKIVYWEPDDMGQETFLRITFGQRPLVVMMDNGCATTTYHYRNINERQVVDFLKTDTQHN